MTVTNFNFTKGKNRIIIYNYFILRRYFAMNENPYR